MVKNVYSAPSLTIVKLHHFHMIAQSYTVNGAEGLGWGGNTGNAGITYGNVKSNEWWGEIW